MILEYPKEAYVGETILIKASFVATKRGRFSVHLFAEPVEDYVTSCGRTITTYRDRKKMRLGFVPAVIVDTPDIGKTFTVNRYVDLPVEPTFSRVAVIQWDPYWAPTWCDYDEDWYDWTPVNIKLKPRAIGNIVEVKKSAAEAMAGATVTIEVVFENKGNLSDNFSVKLIDKDTNEEIVTSKPITLSPGGRASYSASLVMPGKNYNIAIKLLVGTEVHGEQSVTINLIAPPVKEPVEEVVAPPVEEIKPPIPLILGGVTLAGLYYLTRKK